MNFTDWKKIKKRIDDLLSEHNQQENPGRRN